MTLNSAALNSATLAAIASALSTSSPSSFFKPQRPRWCNDRDALSRVVDGTAGMWKRGRVVWGALVQANNVLFAPGADDAPMSCIYSFDPWYAEHPDLLARLAAALAGLKHQQVPEHAGLARIAHDLTDELRRSFAVPVPADVTAGREVLLTTTMVFREALPTGVLRDSIFPLCALPGEEATSIPPASTWPAPLIARWR